MVAESCCGRHVSLWPLRANSYCSLRASLQVLDEIGVDLGAAMPAAKQQRLPAVAAKQQVGSEDQEADELATRLAALK